MKIKRPELNILYELCGTKYPGLGFIGESGILFFSSGYFNEIAGAEVSGGVEEGQE